MILSDRFIVLILASLPFFILNNFNPIFLKSGIGYIVLLFLLAFIDYLFIPSPKKISLSREYDKNFSLNDKNLITLIITNLSNNNLLIDIKDNPPASFHSDRKIIRVHISSFAKRKIQYALIPYKRGDYQFGEIYIRIWGKCKFTFQQKKYLLGNNSISVYPNLSLIKKYNISPYKIPILMGLRPFNLRGIGTDFESLRSYSRGDELRWIHWKATAKRYKPISKNFQIERNQDIYLLLDCGRTMAEEIKQKSRLDYIINFSLSLAFIALKAGDNVGIVVFSDKIQTFLPPRKNRGYFGNIIKAIYNLKVSPLESDYRKLFYYFTSQKKKRALLILFTELKTGASSNFLISNIGYLSRNHLPLIVTMKNTDILKTADITQVSNETFFKKSIASQLLIEREKISKQLIKNGALLIDSPPNELSTELLNKYLEIKTKIKL